MKKSCKFPECGRPVKAKEYCDGHRKQILHGRDEKELRPIRPRRAPALCAFADGCGDDATSQGYCARHYAQMMRRGEIQLISPREVSGKHGASMRGNHRCDCEVCKKEYAEKQIADRARRLQAPREEVPHGLSGYRNWGCDCPICKAAGAAKHAERMAARRGQPLPVNAK